MLQYRYDAIKELRLSLGLSMGQFGKGIGKSKEAVSGWESGERIPHVSTICAICNAYNVDITFFFRAERIAIITAHEMVLRGKNL